MTYRFANEDYQYPYHNYMGIKVGGKRIPDPSEWTYQVGDLDTSGRRDANGLLHRKMVATKINYEFSWNVLEWKMLQYILAQVNTAKFTLVAPDPRTFNTLYTGNYYVGDRTGKAKYFLPNGDAQTFPAAPGGRPEAATYTLKLKFIEY